MEERRWIRFERESLMKQVAFVFQNPKLRKATLEDNIRGGCHDADRECDPTVRHIWHSVMIF